MVAVAAAAASGAAAGRELLVLGSIVVGMGVLPRTRRSPALPQRGSLGVLPGGDGRDGGVDALLVPRVGGVLVGRERPHPVVEVVLTDLEQRQHDGGGHLLARQEV